MSRHGRANVGPEGERQPRGRRPLATERWQKLLGASGQERREDLSFSKVPLASGRKQQLGREQRTRPWLFAAWVCGERGVG